MKRIRDIVTDLRAFAYPESQNLRERFEFPDALETALRFTANDRNGIDVDRELTANVSVMGSKSHITQVLVNLLSNAQRAVASVNGDRDARISISTQTEGDRLTVKVRDTGVGIESEVLSKIFDPFFTTTDVGQGMGLGLSICHTIIRNHGGEICVNSVKDEWTEVTFDLPLAQ